MKSTGRSTLLSKPQVAPRPRRLPNHVVSGLRRCLPKSFAAILLFSFARFRRLYRVNAFEFASLRRGRVLNLPRFRTRIQERFAPATATALTNMPSIETVSEPIALPTVTEQRVVPVVSWPAFALVTALLPVWATTVVPLSALYQLGKAMVRRLGVFQGLQPRVPSFDSGYVVDPSSVVPRSERKYDVIVLGATGFCGGLAARYLARTYGMDGAQVKWAIAGRSLAKLKQVRTDIVSEGGVPKDQVKIDLIVVDSSFPATLPNLVQQTRVVATTAGPYTAYGNHLVEFCAKFGTHYVDITGEVDWVKSMYGLWQETAQKTGAKLVSFCGHDSVPWDLSLFKMKQAMKERNDDLRAVEFWDEAVAEAPGGTFATIMTFLDGNILPPPVNFDPFSLNEEGLKSMNTMTIQLPLFPSPANSPWDTGKPSRRWQAPFIMALVNSQVCRWSHSLQSTDMSKELPIRNISYTESMLCPDFKSALVGYLAVFVLFSLAANPLTRPLLNRAIPSPGDGPDAERMESSHFLCVYGAGEGEKGNRVETCLYFPKDPGCVETARMMVESALCLALQEDQLKCNKGGFWTPATALGDVLMDRLLKTGASFQQHVIAPS